MSFTKAGQILVDSNVAELAKKTGFQLGKGTGKLFSNGLSYKLWEPPNTKKGFASFSVAETYLGVFANDEDIYAYVEFFWINEKGKVTHKDNKEKVKELLLAHPEWFNEKGYELWGGVKKDNKKKLEFNDIKNLEKYNSFSLTSPSRETKEDVKKDLLEFLEILKEYKPPEGKPNSTAGVKVIEEDERDMKDSDFSKYITLLKENHNIILHGAPGTGKTHLAKEIAKAMGAQWQMVQFHPSYDYTDFVEGLRPTAPDSNGQIGFELKDGVFKSFCAEALPQNKSNFEDLYAKFLDSLEENPDKKFETKVKKCKFHLQRNSNDGLYVIPCTKIGTKMPLTKNLIKDYVENGNIRDWKSYLTVVGDAVKGMDKTGLKLDNENNSPKDYVFIVDEINRGDMSKILGELFYSIDPGYRGIEGRIKTQYANMCKTSPSDFDLYLQNKKIVNPEDNGYFFIPKNVYIIGTMNDIDRSVESMDFAMRRRFAFKEVKADDRIEMLDSLKCGKKDEAVKRMQALNKEIEHVEGLSSAYHIGPAYFLKLDNYSGDFDKLWEYHIKGLLEEYFRGMPDSKNLIEKMESAYMA